MDNVRDGYKNSDPRESAQPGSLPAPPSRGSGWARLRGWNQLIVHPKGLPSPRITSPVWSVWAPVIACAPPRRKATNPWTGWPIVARIVPNASTFKSLTTSTDPWWVSTANGVSPSGLGARCARSRRPILVCAQVRTSGSLAMTRGVYRGCPLVTAASPGSFFLWVVQPGGTPCR